MPADDTTKSSSEDGLWALIEEALKHAAAARDAAAIDELLDFLRAGEAEDPAR